MQQANSFRLYACYYALLCLLHLHQQHQVCSLTIIIDGATTSEWATRDEYQRLVQEQQQAAAEGQSSGPNNYPDPNPGSEPSFKQLELSPGGPVEAALDQLDLIGLQQQQRQRLRPHLPGARTLGDLVAQGDQLGADGPIRERDFSLGDSAPHNYCGTQLIEILEVICNGRYYTGQPEVVQPTVKSKRYLEASRAPTSADAFYQRLAPVERQPAQGRRRQRTALEAPPTSGDGAETEQSAKNRHSKMSLYRRIRQVVGECCHQPCTFKSLEKYCMGQN